MLVAAMAKSSIMPKITKHLVEAAEIRDKHYTITDSQIPGFGIRIMRGGTRTYVVMYRAGGRRRRMGLGHHGVTTPEQARTSAINILARVRNGEDPAASRQGGDHITTVTDLAERFDEEHIAVRLKPKSAHNYRLHLRAHILPALSHFSVTEIKRSDIANLHHKLRGTSHTANRCLAVLSKMFNLAELWDLRPDGSNPCRHVKKYPEAKRERYLSTDELGRLGKVLHECEQEGIETQASINAIRLLVFTGCRLSEIMTLQWDYVDLESGAPLLSRLSSTQKKQTLSRWFGGANRPTETNAQNRC